MINLTLESRLQLVDGKVSLISLIKAPDSCVRDHVSEERLPDDIRD